MPETFLFVLWAGGGNVPPQLAMARRLAARGHDVRVLGPRALRGAIEVAGLAYEPYHATPEHDEASASTSLIRDFEARTPIGAASAVRERLLADMAAPVAEDVLGILRATRIDVVAADYFLLGALFAAESAGVPSAMLVHTVYPFPAPGLPPFGMGWMPAGGPPDRVRDAVGHWLFHRAYEAPLLPRLNAVRSKLGLGPVTSLTALIERADRVLVLTSQAFDFPAKLPGNVRYVGPQLDDPAWTPEWHAPWPLDDRRPLVTVGLTTTYQQHERLLRAAIQALGGLDVRGLVSTGGVDPGPLPPNVVATPWVPHRRVFPSTSVVITHGGLGTVHNAIASGVPLVCLPIGRDQPDNAARVVWHHAGVRKSSLAGPAAIRKAISEVLANPQFSESARRLGAAMAVEESAVAGPDALLSLVRPRSVTTAA